MRPPDISGGGLLTTDRPTAQNAAAAKLQVLGERTSRQRKARTATPLRVFGRGEVVTSRSGRRRLVVIVSRCRCSDVHLFTAAPDWREGLRQARCGRLWVLAVVDERQAVA